MPAVTTPDTNTVITTADDGSPGDDGRRTVVRWLRPDGHAVAVDEPLCEVTGDGTTVEAVAPQAGVLRHGVAAGQSFAVGDEVFRIDTPR